MCVCAHVCVLEDFILEKHLEASLTRLQLSVTHTGCQCWCQMWPFYLKPPLDSDRKLHSWVWWVDLNTKKMIQLISEAVCYILQHLNLSLACSCIACGQSTCLRAVRCSVLAWGSETAPDRAKLAVLWVFSAHVKCFYQTWQMCHRVQGHSRFNTTPSQHNTILI